MDLAINNPQWLICHKPNQTTNQPNSWKNNLFCYFCFEINLKVKYFGLGPKSPTQVFFLVPCAVVM